jgi:hypothetical protein
MASHVASAAGEEVDHALQTVRGDRFVDKIPGTRTGTSNINQPGGGPRQTGRQRYTNRAGSGSSGSGEQGGGIGLGLSHGYGVVGRGYTGRKCYQLSWSCAGFLSARMHAY